MVAVGPENTAMRGLVPSAWAETHSAAVSDIPSDHDKPNSAERFGRSSILVFAALGSGDVLIE